MFRRHTEYHGTRNYAVESTGPTGIEWFRLKTTVLSAWVKLQIEKFLRAGAPASTTTWLVRGGEKHFTELGSRHENRKASIADIFPIASAEARTAAARPRKSR